MIAAGYFDAVRNVIRDPGFESGVLFVDARSTKASVTDATAVVSAPALIGSYSLKLAASANGYGSVTDTLVAVGWRLPAEQNVPVFASALAAYATGPASIALEAFDGSGTSICLVASSAVTSAGRMTVAFACPDTAETVMLWARIGVSNVGDVPQAIFDEMLMCWNPPYMIDGFSGDSGGAEWSGARYFSDSLRVGEASAMETARDAMPEFYFSDPTFAVPDVPVVLS